MKHLYQQKIIGGKAFRGFTLIESVIALGVFAFAIAILLGVFSKIVGQGREQREQASLIGLMSAIDAKLHEIGWSRDLNGGIPGVIEQTDSQPMLLVADVDRCQLALLNESETLSLSEQYYLIVVTRYDEVGHVFGRDLFGVIVLRVRISWPYHVPVADGYREIDESERRSFEFVSTLRP